MTKDKDKDINKEEKDISMEGLNIHINEFGQIETDLPVEQVNEFLDENVNDKKFLSKDEEE